MRGKSYLNVQISFVLSLALWLLGTPVHADLPVTYTVEKGDHLYKIARRFNTDVASIVKANHIPDPNLIYPGQVLIIPKPVQTIEATTSDEAKEPALVKGIYLSFFALGHDGLREHVLNLLKRTELNAVVIDVKEDRGFIPYRSDVLLAEEVGAHDFIMVKDFDALMNWFEENEIYTIARVVVFKDSVLASSRPDLAVKDSLTGGIWRNRKGLAWTDPFCEEVWDYNIAIAKDAAKRGFDEIQFDYIRFPTDGDVSRAVFSMENTSLNRVAAISGFLKKAREELKPLGVKIAVDVFGYTTWRKDDMGIGQRIEEMAKYVDFISPMVYPSTYHDGIPGYQCAIAYPYEIVYFSVKRAVERLEGVEVSVRPWLQDFRDYAFDGRAYSAREIRAQIRGAYDAGASGWMLWDPRVRYTAEALIPEKEGG
jgi:hypothetical protein